MNASDDAELGSSLVESGVISQGQLEEVRHEAEESGAGLVSVLLEKGYASAADLAVAAQGREDAPPQLRKARRPSPLSARQEGYEKSQVLARRLCRHMRLRRRQSAPSRGR